VRSLTDDLLDRVNNDKPRTIHVRLSTSLTSTRSPKDFREKLTLFSGELESNFEWNVAGQSVSASGVLRKDNQPTYRANIVQNEGTSTPEMNFFYFFYPPSCFSIIIASIMEPTPHAITKAIASQFA